MSNPNRKHNLPEHDYDLTLFRDPDTQGHVEYGRPLRTREWRRNHKQRDKRDRDE